MRAEVIEYYGLTKSFTKAGYYETEHHRQLFKDIKTAILDGKLIAVCGVVGRVRPSPFVGCSSPLLRKTGFLCPNLSPCKKGAPP
jgi:hypothetical protein